VLYLPSYSPRNTIYQVFTGRATLKMEKHALYDPVAQNDVPESPFSEAEDQSFGDEHTSRKSPSSYAKLGAIIVILLVLYTIAIVDLTMRVAHRDRRVGRRFLGTPVDNNYIVYDARVMEQWEDVGQGPKIEYFTPPSEEIDRNWHEIVDRMFSRRLSLWLAQLTAHILDQNLGIREDVMKAMGREKEGIKLPDGTYYGSLMVFHHLHCLVSCLKNSFWITTLMENRRTSTTHCTLSITDSAT
jgi:hypothetical protein